MVGQPKKYIFSLAGIDEKDVTLVGERALLLHEIDKIGIPIPKSFVITTNAFDDFIIANDLVGFISQRINEIDYTNERNVAKSSAEIRKAINAGNVPDIISEPLGKAYSGLSNLFESFVNLRTSPPFKELNEVNYGKQFMINAVKGLPGLIVNLKLLWSNLFTEEALMFRAKNVYEGALTQAVLVQRMIQAEATGRVYTINPADNNKDIAEIQAVLGLADAEEIGSKIIPDSYFFNKTTEEITEKKIVGQEKMLVRKGSIDGKGKNEEIKISEVWQKKQKIDDKNVLNLGRIASTLEEIYGFPLELDYVMETGKVFITEIKTLIDHTLPETGDKRSMLEVAGEEYKGSVLEEEDKSTDLGAIADDGSGGHIVDEEEERDISSYVEEIQAEELLPEAPPIQVEEEIKEDAVEKKPIIAESTEEITQNNSLKQQIITSDKPDDTKEVTVVLKPINDLEKVLDGVGFGSVNNFGLAHFIMSDADWYGLTGDEILVLDNLDKQHLQEINASRGLVLVQPLPEDDLQLIKVPTIHAVETAKVVLRENEVISLVPEKNAIYVGAIKNQPAPIFREGPQSRRKEMDVATALFGQVQYNESDKKENKIQSLSKVWQIFDPKDPLVDVLNTDGVVVSMSDLYKLAGLTPDYLLTEPEQRRAFIQEVVNVLVPLLKELDTRQMIIKLNDLSLEELQQLKGSERINYESMNLPVATRIIKIPNMINMELELISILRNRESMRNVWIALPEVNTASEQTELKKAISAFGFRRSSTFKLISTISRALGVISIKEILENDIDGIILDYDKIAEDFTKDRYQLDDNFYKFMLWAVENVTGSKTQSLILHKKVEISKDNLKDILEKGTDNYIVSREQLYAFKLLVSGLEVKRIAVSKKRGRKKKKIDYGF